MIYDAIIIGGGPSGAVSAFLFAANRQEVSHIGEENAYCRKKRVVDFSIQWWHKSIAVNRIRCKRTARYGRSANP